MIFAEAKAKSIPAPEPEPEEVEPSELAWGELEPSELWEDMASLPDPAPAPADTTNNWEEGVLWPEESAPAADDSFQTLTSFPSPEDAKRASFGSEERTGEKPEVKESKKEQKSKKKSLESPNKENKKEKKEKKQQAKGATAGSDTPDEGELFPLGSFRFHSLRPTLGICEKQIYTE